MNMSLYQIEKEYMALAQQLIDNSGELTDEISEQLAISQESLQTKGINYGFVIKQMEAECDAIDNEIKRLAGLKKSRTNAAERLKTAIGEAMELFEIEEIKIATLKINFRKSESVEVEELSLLDKRFIKTVVTETADKVHIKEAIKAGEAVTGATLRQNKNLQIK